MSRSTTHTLDADEPDIRSTDGPHAPGALLWGVLTQLRYPTVLALFLVSGLATAASVFAFTGAGGATTGGSPLAVPATLLAVVAWTVAYCHVGSVLDSGAPLRLDHLRAAARRLPDLVLVYGTILGLVYASARLSFWLFSGHYTPRFVFFGVALVIVVNTLLATPAILLGDASLVGSLYAAWTLAREVRLTLLGIWFITAMVVFWSWYLLWTLVRSYPTVQALVLFGVGSGIFLGGFHLALVRVYAWAETESRGPAVDSV